MSEKKIGRYEIKSELGRGGMATVYLAYDPVLERDVALKLLPNYFAHDPEFSARFEREAKTVAALEHGSIVSMYDYGEDGQWPYFVMRLMKGGSLKDRIEEGPMDLAEAARIVSRVAGALDKAHSKEIVHRDLKPGNIMFDEDGMAYLGDFGIVKLAESAESYTRTGNTMGTPAYMSPEQADGKPDIDGRSDIYSLGIVLYEMLTGTAPYTHESMPRLLIMHLTAPIPNILEAHPDLPAGIQAVIEKAMAKDRDERYATAGELAEAVQAMLAGEKTAVTPEPAPVVETKPEREPEPMPMRAAPVVEIEREPVVETETAVPQPKSAAPPKPEPTPPPDAKSAPTQPAAAQRGGIPKWLYAVAGLVVVVIIGVIALAGGGSGDNFEPAAVAEEVKAPAEANLSGQFDPGFNYFDDPDQWDYFFDEGDDTYLYFEDGQAIFSTQLQGPAWANYREPFGDGTYEVEVTATAARAGSSGFGMLVMYDETSWSWYEFTLNTNGDAAVFYCEEGCDAVDEPLFDGWTHFDGVEAGLDAANTLRIEANQGSLTFYVNDQELGTIFDDRRTSGNIGLILHNDSEQDLEVVFDNFTYTPAP